MVQPLVLDSSNLADPLGANQIVSKYVQLILNYFYLVHALCSAIMSSCLTYAPYAIVQEWNRPKMRHLSMSLSSLLRLKH